jgi:hypothetical protein
MEDHLNNADGVPQGVVIISTNAGIKGTKAWAWRQNALQSARWKVLIRHTPAPWVSEEDVEEARQRDPVGAEFSRLWEGMWISGAGTALDEGSIDRCFRLDGPIRKRRKGWRYLAGLDLGETHDHAGVALVGVNCEVQRVRVVYVKGWEPSLPNDKGRLEVDSAAVEKACKSLDERFQIEWFGYDPAAGGRFMAQRLRGCGIEMREMSFGSPKNCTAMATCFVQLVKDGKLECYEDDEGRLRRDFGKFNIVHKPPSGYKLEAVSDEYGHADVGTALVITLPEAMQILDSSFWALQGEEDVLATPEDDEKEFDKEDVERMPPELRGIYEVEEEAAREYRQRERLGEYWE